ncbi:MAG: hypothetical protein PVF73_03205 [Bacteroidales bacterium]|jgi:extradiol dioxygenase family protein
MIKHIALEIDKSDLRNFYVNILGGKIGKQFVLDREDASEIFNIHRSADIYYLSLEEVDLELFVREHPGRSTFHHFCLETGKAKTIYLLAKEKGYWTHVRNPGDRETYFIRDKNGNTIEMKHSY